MGWRRRLIVPGSLLLALAVYAGLALYLTHGAWQAPRTEVIGANGDAPHDAWYLAWVAFAVSHGTDPLVVTYLSPPGHPIGLMWQDAAPLLGLLLTPVTLAAGATFAYNLGVTAGLALSATSAYLTIGTVSVHRGPAWVGGLIFGFSPWILGEAADGHLFLVNLWLVPPLLYFLVRVLRADHHRMTDGLVLGAIAAAQLLISQEILADCLLVGGLVAIGFAVANWRRLRQWFRQAGRETGLAAGTFAVFAGVPLAAALFGPGHGLHGSLESPFGFFDDLLTLVVPKGGLLGPAPLLESLGNRLAPAFGPALYLGLPLVLIITWAGWRYRADPWVRGSVLVAASAVVLSLGPELTVAGLRTGVPLPWAILVHLPIFSVMAPDRMGSIACLAVGLCLALVLDRHWPERMDALVAGPAALALVAVLPLVPSGPLARWIVPTPAFFTAAHYLQSIPQGSEVAVAGPGVRYNVDAMVWQADSGFRFRLPWGYAITAGPHGRRISAVPDGALGALWQQAEAGALPPVTVSVKVAVRADLCGWGARAVIVGPTPNRSLVVAATSLVLGRGPNWRGGAAFWQLPAHWCG